VFSEKTTIHSRVESDGALLIDIAFGEDGDVSKNGACCEKLA
jgi:hypothetical protein